MIRVSCRKPTMRYLLTGFAVVLLGFTTAQSQQRKPAKPAPAKRPSPQQKAPQPATGISPEIRMALDHISANSMRGHLSFIASDMLAGRNTPSPGLEIASEYIAAQFRRAGLEPGGDAGSSGEKGYFQTADWKVTEADNDSFEMTINDGSEIANVKPGQVSLSGELKIDLKSVPLVKVDYSNAAALAALRPELIAGKVVITEIPDFRREDRSLWMEMSRARTEFLSKIRGLNPAFIISVDRVAQFGTGLGGGRLIDPDRATQASGAPAPQFLTVVNKQVIKMFDSMAAGDSKGTISLKTGPPLQKPAKVRNVIGVLRGSDPVLKDTYVIVSAHYDHVGGGTGAGCAPIGDDNICNGANDDGSGTVSVIELASALGAIKQRPKRTIVFITWFGEEKGLLGSRFYGKHPAFPLDKTVAMVNLEQVGRTDSSEGPQLNNASMTGFDFTDLGPIFKAAGEKTGITVYKHEKNSDPFFGRSDNQALADAGIPAHTLCVAFVYPDYHQAGDHWEKIDYDNMARVNQMVGLSLLTIADNTDAPKWNEANPKTARYLQAWKGLQK